MIQFTDHINRGESVAGSLKRLGIVSMGALSLIGSVAVGTASAAGQSADTVTPNIVTTPCANYKSNGVSWGANCTIPSGNGGSITYCSSGTKIVGPLLTPTYYPETYYFFGSCAGYGTITSVTVYWTA
ncbi:hypothetical protein [Streptomyces sp. NPDC088350]|uniref:hypothetical protein n=1 Tax=Streptomyces sp. NPDC088350 TaxID=3365854 RepID=UPI0037F3D318